MAKHVFRIRFRAFFFSLKAFEDTKDCDLKENGMELTVSFEIIYKVAYNRPALIDKVWVGPVHPYEPILMKILKQY